MPATIIDKLVLPLAKETRWTSFWDGSSGNAIYSYQSRRHWTFWESSGKELGSNGAYSYKTCQVFSIDSLMFHSYAVLFFQNTLYGSHICGEGGEYETLTLDCPLFKSKIILLVCFCCLQCTNSSDSEQMLRLSSTPIVALHRSRTFASKRRISSQNHPTGHLPFRILLCWTMSWKKN